MGARSGGGGGGRSGGGGAPAGYNGKRPWGVSGTAKSEYNQKEEIQKLGYHVLPTIGSKQVLVVKSTKKGGMSKTGYKFDSMQEAYDYFGSK